MIVSPDNTYWVIASGRGYWDGSSTQPDSFQNGPESAIRFAREQDAEQVIHHLLEEHSVFLASRKFDYDY